MIYVLFALVILLSCIILAIYNFEIENPAFLMIIGWDISIMIAMTQYKNWGDITERTIFIIILGITGFFLGGLMSKGNTLFPKEREIGEIVFTKGFIVFALLFYVIYAFLNYRYIQNAAYDSGYSSGENNMLSYVRKNVSEESKMPYYLYISGIVFQAFSYLISYEIIYNFLFKKKISFLILKIFATGITLFVFVMSTGRTLLINYILFVFCSTAIVLKKIKAHNAKKILAVFSVSTMIILLVLFVIIDVFFRSSIYGNERNIEDQIALYTSSSVYALDSYIKQGRNDSNDNSETLYSFYSLLRRAGFDTDMKENDIALGFEYFGNVKTNIYTSFKRYLHDYGILGLLFIQVLLGYFYNAYFYHVISNNSSHFLSIIYCAIIYAPTFSSIEERFFINVLSLRSILLYFCIYILLILVCKKTNHIND